MFGEQIVVGGGVSVTPSQGVWGADSSRGWCVSDSLPDDLCVDIEILYH